MDILKMIKNGSEYIVPANLGKTFDDYLLQDKDEYYMLVPNVSAVDRWSLKRLLSKYYVSSLFELSNCYVNAWEEAFLLMHIIKQKPDTIKMSVYNNFAHPFRNMFEESTYIPEKYDKDYLSYLNRLNNWLTTNEKPEANAGGLYYLVPSEEFDPDAPFPRFYTRSNEELRKMLREEKVVKLSDVAEIVDSHLAYSAKGNKQFVKTLNSEKDHSYPFVPELCAVDGIPTTELLKKGDIVLLGKTYFLIDKDSTFPLYAPLGVIIRAKTEEVSAEYLYLYLNSKVANQINSAYMNLRAGYSQSRYNRHISDYPIVVPKRDQGYYIQEFMKLSAPDKRYYDEKRVLAPKTIEEKLVAELADRIIVSGEALVKKVFEQDFIELNNCFQLAKAYKATIIMAGSILETFLLDWVSEIKGENYFQNDLLISKPIWDNETHSYKTDEKGNYVYKKQKAALADIIDEIHNEYKDWEESKDAHRIRVMRNQVHVQVCISSQEISKETCNEIVNALQAIMYSRERIRKDTEEENE